MLLEHRVHRAGVTRIDHHGRAPGRPARGSARCSCPKTPAPGSLRACCDPRHRRAMSPGARIRTVRGGNIPEYVSRIFERNQRLCRYPCAPMTRTSAQSTGSRRRPGARVLEFEARVLPRRSPTWSASRCCRSAAGATARGSARRRAHAASLAGRARCARPRRDPRALRRAADRDRLDRGACCCRTRSSTRRIRTRLLREVERVLMGEGQRGHLRLQSARALGPAQLAFARALPAACGPPAGRRAHPRLAAPARLRGRRSRGATCSRRRGADACRRGPASWLERRGPELFAPLAGAYVAQGAQARARAHADPAGLAALAPVVVGGAPEPTPRNAA